MEQAVPAQYGFDDDVQAVADNGEWNIQLDAKAFERNDPFIYGKAGSELDQRVPVGPNELDLSRQTFLTRDLPVHPSVLPFPPGGKREGFQHGVGRVNSSDRAVEVAKHVCASDVAARTLKA